jgi:hypothetical protein
MHLKFSNHRKPQEYIFVILDIETQEKHSINSMKANFDEKNGSWLRTNFCTQSNPKITKFDIFCKKNDFSKTLLLKIWDDTV